MKRSPFKALTILIMGAVAAALSQIFFSRGLSLDGVHILYTMIKTKDFYFIETSRIITHFFQQLPTWLFINFAPSNSLSALSWTFSFGLIWIHLISFIGSYLILPTNKKSFLIFPLFAFFTGPLTAMGVSISASLSVFSYVWLVAFAIRYSDLSFKSNQILFILIPIPLLFSHELMSYMAWPLILLCYLKIKTQKQKPAVIIATMILLFITSILSWFFIIFPEKSELGNRGEFFNSLFKFEFFFKIKEGRLEWIYPACITAFFFLMLPFNQFFKKKYRSLYLKIIFLFLILSGVVTLILPFYQQLFGVFKLTNEEEARVWASVIVLPLSFLIWWLFEKGTFNWEKSFLSACIIVVLSLTGWRVGSDYQFYKFQKQFSKQLSFCRGFVDWNEVAEYNEEKYQHLFKLFNWGWKYMSSSIIYPRHLNVQAVIKSKNRFHGCYRNPPYGMCENNIDTSENRFFNFKKVLYYEKTNDSGCFIKK